VLVSPSFWLALWTVLNKTDIGQKMQAVGSNMEAARLSGIRVDRIKIFAFATAGFCAALTGTLLSSLLGSGTLAAADGYLLDVDYAVRITDRGLFVHSAPWAVNSLGYENVSHGCISLSPEDAEWYFNTVNVGDPVIVQENSIEVPRTVSG